jgi:hypothetical protein
MNISPVKYFPRTGMRQKSNNAIKYSDDVGSEVLATLVMNVFHLPRYNAM